MIGLLSDKSFGFGTVKTVPYNLFYSLLQTFKSTFNSYFLPPNFLFSLCFAAVVR